MNSEYKFADDVWARIIQVIQEAMMTGINVSDLLRELRVTHSQESSDTLVLTEKYKELVKRSHAQLLEKAEQLKAQRDFLEDV